MRRWCAEMGRSALAAGLVALATLAQAQQPGPPPPASGPGPALALPPGAAPPALPTRPGGVATPSLANPNLPPVSAPRESTLSLGAVFAGGRPIKSGLVWRIYEDRPQGGDLTVLARSEAANPSFSLAPGAYVADVAYGFASALKHIVVPADGLSEQITVTAGALSLGGAVAQNPIPADRLSFAVYVPVGNDVEGRLIRNGIKAGELVRLPEGTYHVVSTYGDSNAIQSADLKVENAKVTQATMNHRAATVTLKLVEAPGTEAFAGTAFSVLTPGGDTIREAIGAFPSVTLAEGDYVLIARHDGQVYTRDFKVENGMDRDIEVVAKGP